MYQVGHIGWINVVKEWKELCADKFLRQKINVCFN